MSKKKTLIWIIVFIFTNIFSGVIGYYVGQGLDWLYTEHSISIIMPEESTEEGEFLITLVNGNTDLENIKVNIKSCYMKNNSWKHYYIDDLPANKEYSLKFFEEKTKNQSSLINCRDNPIENLPERRMNATMCQNIETGEIFVPSKNDSFYMCGFCSWNITIETNQKNFSFIEEMFLPIGFLFETIGDSNEDFKANSSKFLCTENLKFIYYGKRELEIMGEYD